MRWNLFNALGSVVGTVDASGTIVAQRRYDVYGAVRGLAGESGPRHKFVGGLGHPSEDETGLIYMQARYMHPAMGRFVSDDPARHGQNWFAYARNAPTRYFHPDSKVQAEDIFETIRALLETIESRGWEAGGQEDLQALQNTINMLLAAISSEEAEIIGKGLHEAFHILGHQKSVYDALIRIGKALACYRSAKVAWASAWGAYHILMGCFGIACNRRPLVG